MITQEFKESIFENITRRLEAERTKCYRIKNRDFTPFELQQVVRRITAETYLELTDDSIVLIIQNEDQRVSLSELYQMHMLYTIDFLITINLEMSDEFYKQIAYSDSCTYYSEGICAQIHLSDFISFIISNIKW